jgi:Holliday junction resolvase RusA-like endonuclease
MTGGGRWYPLNVNPEPWSMGSPTVIKRGGKWVPVIAPNRNLAAYKEAVREAVLACEPDEPLGGDVRICFFFWRNVAGYKMGEHRRSRNRVDATNMQKATEDALQGILFDNDRNTVDVRSVVVEQGPDVVPFIAIHVAGAEAVQAASEVPSEILAARQAVSSEENGVSQLW